MQLETLKEEEEYSWREVKLPALLPHQETWQSQRGRDILIAIDHAPNSKHAFHWAITHLCNLSDTLHLLHVVSSTSNEIVYGTSQALMEKLSVEAFKVAMVKCEARIVQGSDAGKAICKEAERLRPMAVVMGTRGRSLVKSVLQGSVSEYCFHNCRVAPIIIVPGQAEFGNETPLSGA